MGCGRVGASLADGLARIGHDVAVIDRDSTAFNRLSPEFPGERVLGMGFDRDVLLRAGIEEASAFAAVSSGDNSNIISARVARETFGVERVVARIYDAKRAKVYERLGIPTVATVPWTTDRLLNVLTGETETTKWRDPSGNVGVAELALHEGWSGRRMADLEAATGGRVAFIIRPGLRGRGGRAHRRGAGDRRAAAERRQRGRLDESRHRGRRRRRPIHRA
jgi:trk system potassium uptake protein TrkA